MLSHMILQKGDQISVRLERTTFLIRCRSFLGEKDRRLNRLEVRRRPGLGEKPRYPPGLPARPVNGRTGKQHALYNRTNCAACQASAHVNRGRSAPPCTVCPWTKTRSFWIFWACGGSSSTPEMNKSANQTLCEENNRGLACWGQIR